MESRGGNGRNEAEVVNDWYLGWMFTVDSSYLRRPSVPEDWKMIYFLSSCFVVFISDHFRMMSYQVGSDAWQ